MNDAYRHGQLAETDRQGDLRRAALDAEWQGATGDFAGVIRQLRYRGNQFSMRATWIYRGLLLVILVGLTFYLGLPYWEKYVDGRRETLQSQQAAHATEHAKLDQLRNALVFGSDGQAGLLDELEITATSISSGVHVNFRNAIVDGQTILLFGDEGAITRSTDDGQSFTPVPSGVKGDLFDAIVDGQNILLFGRNGAIFSVDARYHDRLAGLKFDNGSAGDIVLARFLDGDLPSHIQISPQISDARASLSTIEARRGVLTTLEKETPWTCHGLIPLL